MVPLTALWLPILLAAIAVFAVGSITHMVLSYHNSDFSPVPGEDQLLEDLRRANLPPGDYAVPYAGSPKEMNSPAYQEKVKRGPVAFLTVRPNGPHALGPMLIQWFVLLVVVSIVAAYITSRALGPGAEYREVFRFAGATAFASYTFALWDQSIWYGRKWSTTIKSTFDGLMYALVTAGVFGWLWP